MGAFDAFDVARAIRAQRGSVDWVQGSAADNARATEAVNARLDGLVDDLATLLPATEKGAFRREAARREGGKP